LGYNITYFSKFKAKVLNSNNLTCYQCTLVKKDHPLTFARRLIFYNF